MRIAVALSGGVDSSVAALILKGLRHDVFGLTMTLGDLGGRRSAVEAVDGAAQVAGQIGIEHHVVDLGSEFVEGVVRDFVDEYAAGRTPNPCVICNRRIKFGRLLEEAVSLGAEALATGHHARVRAGEGGRPVLLRGADPLKDQSYFLYGLSPSQLRSAVMPVGEMTKDRVRGIAREAGLTVARSEESADVCFVEGGVADFVAERAPESARPGPILDTDGRRIGEHGGIGRYTIGQRSGLGLSGPERSYVLAIDAATNAVVVGSGRRLYRSELTASRLNWISCGPPRDELEAEAKIRYAAEPASCTVVPSDGGVSVRFRKPQRAVSPGQAVVFYDGDVVLGGGTITA